MTLCARTTVLLVAMLAAVAGITLRPGHAQAEAASARTVVYGINGHCPSFKWGTPKVRPHSGYFTIPCEAGVSHIDWRYWRRTSAFGHCDVLIFNGFRLVPRPGTITLSGVRRHNGRRYFSHLVMKWTTKSGKHKEVLDWKQDRPLGWMWL